MLRAVAALAAAATFGAPLGSSLAAQQSGNAPIAPASAIGPATGRPTFSLLGLASSNEGSDSPIAPRSEIWMGATQPLGNLGRVRFTAIGKGDVRAREAAGASGAVDGMLALRARARVGGAQVWSAVSYGYVNVSGSGAASAAALSPAFGTGFDGARVDTTVSRRVDIGNVSRAEAGLLSSVSGVEFSIGFSVERASRVTTQTVTIDEQSALPPVASAAAQSPSTRITRSLQRRDIASGVASMGFNTGPTTWLVSVSSPIASWITSDALSPRARVSPAIASLAVVQPVTEWLSVVGAASTNSATVGSTALRDDLGAGRNRAFAPVIALGVRLARLPFFGRGDDTPSGILGFESRTIGSVDSINVTSTFSAFDTSSVAAEERDTLRVLLLIDAPKAERVELMGDATQWIVTQMTRNRNGKWRAELKLAPGVHRITVRTDGGKWIAPPNLPIGNDDYGSPVGMIVVKGTR